MAQPMHEQGEPDDEDQRGKRYRRPEYRDDLHDVLLILLLSLAAKPGADGYDWPLTGYTGVE
jgi:hypothetical protein